MLHLIDNLPSAGEMVVDGLGAGAVLADVSKTCGVLHKMTS